MVLQMLGLVVNSYIDANDEEDFKQHRAKASLMDLADMSVPRADFNLPAGEGTNLLDSDDDEPMPSMDLDAIVQSLDVTPLRILAPTRNPPEPQGTPGGYTGSSAGTTQDVLPARTSGADPFGTPGGCSTSVSPRPVVIPKAETLDILDQRSRPSLDLFRNTRRRMKKTPYVELPQGAIIEVSDEDEGDMDIMVELGVEFDKDKSVKGEPLSVAEHNAEFERKVKEDMAAAQAENARKMAAIQEELRANNAKQDQMFMMMQAFFQASGGAPQLALPSQFSPHGQSAAGPSHQHVPHPTPVGTPPAEVPAPRHDAIAAAIQEDEDLRTRVRESAGPAVLTPPPSRVGLASQTMLEGREGHDTAQHTDVVIVEDTQGSPSDEADLQVMEVEESPDREPQSSTWMENVRMDALDLGVRDEEAERIQQTQSSPPERAEDVMDTESPPRVEITNARSLIAEEGAAAPSSAAAPPPGDEVTHL